MNAQHITSIASIDAFFASSLPGLAMCRAVTRMVAAIGPADVRVTKSQVSFRRRRAFAWVWQPGMYVRSDVPAVLSIALPHYDPSPRFKEVIPVTPGWWMHHLELRDGSRIDAEVRGWLTAAWDAADQVTREER